MTTIKLWGKSQPTSIPSHELVDIEIGNQLNIKWAPKTNPDQSSGTFKEETLSYDNKNIKKFSCITSQV